MSRGWLAAIVLVAALFPALSRPPVAGAARNLYVDVTGHNVGDPILRFYQRYGGLQVFGYPLTEAFSANGLTVQYFERARFEYHPEYSGTQYEILLGLLGNEMLRERRWIR